MTRLLLTVSAIVLITGHASAQNNWMTRANEAMNSPTGQQLIQSMTGTQTTAVNPNGLTNTQISGGLKEALGIGTQNVVAQLGKTGGFGLDPKIHIPLPASLQRVSNGLNAVGMGSLATDLEAKMNNAAELATPKAKELFVAAIQKMTIKDAQSILSGSNTSATQYLRKTMGEQLSRDMQPIVTKTMAQAGAVQTYDAMAGKLPLAATMKNTLNSYVTTKATDGIFYYVGQQETAIRTDPAKQTTALLKTVFGAKK